MTTGAGGKRSARFAYGAGARLYDLLSGEPVYRAGRVVGVRMLAARPGDTVLDVGCGTGLNLPLLSAAVGPEGRVVGLDRSPQMLDVARRRIRRQGLRNVALVRADATAFGPHDLETASVDAALATYALSVVDDPSAAWSCMRDVVRPGGRVCVVDMQRPTGRARWLTPMARLACALGGSDIDAHPWTLLDGDVDDLRTRSLRGGHIQVVAGTVSTPDIRRQA